MNKTIIGVIALVLLVGGYFIYRSTTTPATSEDAGEMVVEEPAETVMDAMEGTEATGEVMEGKAMEDVREVEISGKAFEFTPNNLTLKAGEKVKLTFTSTQGTHDFVIEGTDIKTETVTQDKTTIEFTAPEAGTYAFYCSVGNHRAQGMEGVLIVE